MFEWFVGYLVVDSLLESLGVCFVLFVWMGKLNVLRVVIVIIVE